MTHQATHATELFDAHAADYDALRRRLIPPFDAFYGTAVGALDLAARPLRRILDLGAGTGMLTVRVAAAHPEAEITLLDGSGPMLDEARGALGDDARFEFCQSGLEDDLPAGQWDAIVSALAIHHLDDAGKRGLFARSHAALAPGGMFMNAEQVAGPTAFFADTYLAWHEGAARAAGTDDAEWAATLERWRFDRWATVEHQLAWLREAGFPDVDCLFKDHSFAVFAARR